MGIVVPSEGSQLINMSFSDLNNTTNIPDFFFQLMVLVDRNSRGPTLYTGFQRHSLLPCGELAPMDVSIVIISFFGTVPL